MTLDLFYVMYLQVRRLETEEASFVNFRIPSCTSLKFWSSALRNLFISEWFACSP